MLHTRVPYKYYYFHDFAGLILSGKRGLLLLEVSFKAEFDLNLSYPRLCLRPVEERYSLCMVEEAHHSLLTAVSG